MKVISEEEHRRYLEEIKRIGWDNYLKNNYLNESVNSEPTIVQLNCTFEEYNQKYGYIDAQEAMIKIREDLDK
jgi:hypothetical protein